VGRPYYTADLQQKCLQIHRTGVGFNGQPVLFNKRKARRPARPEHRDEYQGLVAALRNMGLKASVGAVQQAIRVLYPAGLGGGQDPNKVLLELFRHFHPDRQNGV
jgi:hypothetical protein